MPVIQHVPSDPTDLVIQGEEMRAQAIAGGVHAAMAPIALLVLLSGAVEPSISTAPIVVAGEQVYSPMAPDFSPPREVLRSPFAGSMIAANALIATPCGALYPLDIGNHLMDAFVESSARWVIAKVTRDSAGAPLGDCRVVVMETGRIAVGGAPVVAETVSDGSGNFAVEVPANTAYQIIAHKDGAPDVAGSSIDTFTPTQV